MAAGRPPAAARERKVDWAAGVEEDKTFKEQTEPLTWRRLGSRDLSHPPPRSGFPTYGVGTVWHWIHGPVGTESRKGVSASTVRESRRDWIGGEKPRILLCIVRSEGKDLRSKFILY